MKEDILREKVFCAVMIGIGLDPDEVRDPEFSMEWRDHIYMAWNIVDEVCDVPEISNLVVND